MGNIEYTQQQKDIINNMEKSVNIQAHYNNFKNPLEFACTLTYLDTLNKKVDVLIKKDFYKSTNDELKKQLEEIGVEKEVIGKLKTKKELVDKIIEVI